MTTFDHDSGSSLCLFVLMSSAFRNPTREFAVDGGGVVFNVKSLIFFKRRVTDSRV